MTDSGSTEGPAADANPPSRTGGGDVFILGAGFSKAVAAGMPTMFELGAEVRARLADDANLESAIPASLGDNIELWMTYLSQPQPWLREPDIDLHRSLGGRIRQAIADVIAERTDLASAPDAPDWLRQLVTAWHLRQATVITLNYDTLVERAARNLKVSEEQGPFLPEDLYPPYFANILSRSGAGLWGRKDPLTFRLLKLHGSVNWHYSGREDFHGETIFFSDVPGFGPAADEAGRDALTRRLRNMAADKETLLIPPVAEKTTYFNNETVRALWKDASAALRNAAALHVVGYSLPMSDLGMQFFLAGNSPDANAPVHVVDIDAGMPDRFREFLQRADVGDRHVGMEDPVVLFAADYAASAMD